MNRLICGFFCSALFPLLVVAAPITSTTSSWSVRVWKSDDGLPNNYVTGIAQTPDGYLWVATYSTPARFDGVRFEEYPSRDYFAGEENQKITALTASRDGGLWMGALHGAIFLLTPKKVEMFGEGLPSRQVQAMVEDGDGALWATSQGGAVVRIQHGQVTSFGAREGLPMPTTPDRYVCSLARDSAGQLWFAKDGQVGVFRDGRFVTLLVLKPVNTRLANSNAGGIWICSGDRLMKYTEGKPLEERGTYGAHQLRTEPTALLEDQKGGVWIGTTDSGLFHYDGADFENVPVSDQQISSLAEDRKGNLWVGTGSGGLNRVNPRVIALESVETGMPSAMVQSTCHDTTGAIWATAQNGLLMRQKDGVWETITIDPARPATRATCVTADATGAVWIGTRDRCLYRWKEGTVTAWRREDGLTSREIHVLHVSKAGDLWIAGAGPDIVQCLRGGHFETFPLPEGVRGVRALAEDLKGNIWLGSTKGMLMRITPSGVMTDETGATTGSPLSIRSLHVTRNGSLWIGYADEGMGWFKDGQFAHLTSNRGFPESNVSQIISDHRGWLWFAGDHGIFKAREEDLENLAMGHTTDVHTVRYGKSEGLVSLEASYGDSPGASRNREGGLWIPMRTTLAVITPDRAPADTEPPPVLLKRVAVDDRVVASYRSVAPVTEGVDLQRPAAALLLPPGHHRLEFEFTALSFNAPENERFRYRIEGLDHEWIDAGTQRTASYSRLATGHYRFQVQACNTDGVWNEQGAVLAFTVAPFVWQTWWFRSIVVLIFTFSTGGIVRYVSLRRVREKLRALQQQGALDKERTRIARDLHDEFGTRLTELGLLAELERKHARTGANGNGADLIGHIRALERDLDTIVWAVNPRNDTLDHLVGFVCRVTGEFLNRSAIRCRFDIPDDLPPRLLTPELRHNLFLVVREVVNNIVKHASATLVKLTIALEGDLLHIRIENDGRGFSVAEAEAGARNGLRNMRSRIEELGGVFTVNSALEKGTTIEFTVPLPPVSASVKPATPAAPHPKSVVHVDPTPHHHWHR